MNIRAFFVCSVSGLLSLTLPLIGQATSSIGPAQGPRIAAAPTQNNTQVVQQQNAITAYRQEQLVLIGKYRDLVNSGASEEQLQQWISANASRIQEQVKKAQAMTLASQSHVPAGAGTVRLPSGFGSAGADYISNQLALDRSSSAPGIQTSLKGNPAGNSFAPARVAQGAISSQTEFVQQNASLLNRQRKLAAAIASTSAQHMPTLSDTEVMPKGATAQVISFLNTRKQLSQQYAQFQRQYATADPATRSVALAQWRKQNSALILQLQNEANDMADAAEAPPATPQN